jgi:hypothetical protein
MVSKSLGLVSVISAALLVSACSGSSNVSSDSFDQLATRGGGLISEFEDAGFTTEAQMPMTGTATYRGVAAFGLDADPDVIIETAEILSNLTLNANFASGAIDSSMTNFRDLQNNVGTGGLDISNGTIIGSQFTADIGGNVALGGESVQIAGEMLGDFVGSGAEYLEGFIKADADFGLTGTEVIIGVFGASRN